MKKAKANPCTKIIRPVFSVQFDNSANLTPK